MHYTIEWSQRSDTLSCALSVASKTSMTIENNSKRLGFLILGHSSVSLATEYLHEMAN